MRPGGRTSCGMRTHTQGLTELTPLSQPKESIGDAPIRSDSTYVRALQRTCEPSSGSRCYPLKFNLPSSKGSMFECLTWSFRL